LISLNVLSHLQRFVANVIVLVITFKKFPLHYFSLTLNIDHLINLSLSFSSLNIYNVCLSAHPFICLFVHLPGNLLVHPSIHHFIHLSNYMPNPELSVCMDVCLLLQQLSLCLSPNPFMYYYASVYATLSASQFLCICHKLSFFIVPLSELQHRLIHICNSFFFSTY
jgi:hypothetical protein